MRSWQSRAAVRGLFVCSVDLLLWVRPGVWGFHVYSWLKHCGARPFTGTYRNDIVDAWLKDTWLAPGWHGMTWRMWDSANAININIPFGSIYGDGFLPTIYSHIEGWSPWHVEELADLLVSSNFWTCREALCKRRKQYTLIMLIISQWLLLTSYCIAKIGSCGCFPDLV